MSVPILGSDRITCTDRVAAMAADAQADDLRRLLRRYPAGVCVLTIASGEHKLGLTVGSLVSLSLHPPLVGFAISREAAMHELLREAGGGALSLLAAGQEWLAQHFARGVPPIAMWHSIAREEGAYGAPLLVGALGWLECALREQVDAGTHTFFVCEIRRVELGVDSPALVRVRGEYASG
jgi:flavin reductase (DIM6/NTAB) family NADH-FMN oxidoreductase RutF